MPANWFCALNGKKVGPFSGEQLRQLAATGRLQPADMVLREGSRTWQKAGEVREIFPSPPPPPPQPPRAEPAAPARGLVRTLAEVVEEAKHMNAYLTLIAAAVPLFGGLFGDLLTPLLSLNFYVFLLALLAAVGLLLLYRHRQRLLGGLSPHLLGVACVFSLVTTFGFGLWWFLSWGTDHRGFIAHNVGFVGRLQDLVYVDEKKVDTTGLFNDAISKEEARKNATELLSKALAELPRSVTAEAPAQPQYDEASSSIVLPVTLRADRQKYAAFAKGLDGLLDKIKVGERDETSLRAEPYRWNSKRVGNLFTAENHAAFNGPSLAGASPKAWTVWLNLFNDDTHQTTRWHGYVVEADAAKCLAGLAGRTRVRVALLDDGKNLVTEDEFDLRDQFTLVADADGQQVADSWGYAPRGATLLPLLYAVRVRDRGTQGLTANYELQRWLASRERDPEATKQFSCSLFLAPYSFTVKAGVNGNVVYYQPEFTMHRKVQVTLDQLKRIKEVRCEVAYRSGLAQAAE